MITLMSIAGARPNFIKLASIVNAIDRHNEQVKEKKEISEKQIHHIIVHTGQHYDRQMSTAFFQDLDLPDPDVNLEVGSGSHAAQTAEIMIKFEPVLFKHQPDILLVVGDVNSTVACALVAAKIQYPDKNYIRRPKIVHVEAGLRSFDREMPEEINRILTDALSDVLFVTEESGKTNLLAEGVAKDKIHFVGNVMIDTLHQHIEKISYSKIKQKLGVQFPYILLTLHRPSNVDEKEILQELIGGIHEISEQCHIVFPVHPRTKHHLEEFNLWYSLANNHQITLSEPLGYLDFLCLLNDAVAVITDSGGIQEETTTLQVPCVTLRKNTERPVTVTGGSNYLIGTNISSLLVTIKSILHGDGKKCGIPRYWDGKASERIIDRLIEEKF
ncbi:MAG: UDP-N-acetylglucosamine 2-epimerase (non-hydrolyzing) [Candidatus Electrothrix sp. AX5]|nr:UDP-N-acetylglucosamine 2-epimerase (non-hydrolyzing) [Candidatus Electrothrix sp. AX5]